MKKLSNLMKTLRIILGNLRKKLVSLFNEQNRTKTLLFLFLIGFTLTSSYTLASVFFFIITCTFASIVIAEFLKLKEEQKQDNLCNQNSQAPIPSTILKNQLPGNNVKPLKQKYPLKPENAKPTPATTKKKANLQK